MYQNEFNGNLEKYNNPIEYDVIHENYNVDLHFIENLLKKNSGTIIELACGTGRLAIPLAQQGFEVYAVDIHEGMLQLAIEKLKTECTRAFYCARLHATSITNHIKFCLYDRKCISTFS